MQTISIVNQKGGTGKTTTCSNLGVALARLKKKVLLIDMDSQANLTFGFDIAEPEMTVVDFLKGKPLDDCVIEREGVFIVPSNADLIGYEIELIDKIGREQKLKNALSNVKGYDYCFLDCGPALGVMTVNALNACDGVLIPMQMEVLPLQGLNKLMETIEEVLNVLNPKLKILGVVACMFNKQRNLSYEVMEEIKKYGLHVFKSVIRVCVQISEAPSFGKSVLSYATNSNGSLDYQSLAKEFLKRR